MTNPRPWWRRPPILAAGSVLAVAGIAVAVWLIRPLFVDDVVDEAFPVATTEAAVPPSSMAPTPANSVGTTVPTESPPATAEPADPVAVLAGSFSGADAAHQGEGQATIYELASGRQVLRFEDFSVTNGPDLRVLLVPVRDPSSPDEVHAEGYVELGELKGNIGDQNYDLPGSVDVSSGEWSIVIYCDPFSVIFATAPLT